MNFDIVVMVARAETGTNRQTELIKLVAAMIVADEQRGAAIGVLPSHFGLRSTRRLTRASGGFV